MKTRVRMARLLLLTSVVGETAFAHAETLGFGESVELALQQAPEVAAAKSATTAAEHRAGSSKALRYPSLRAEANILRWNKPLLVNFAPMNAMPGMSAAPLVVRDRYTTSLSLTVAQPLSGLFALNRQVAIDNIGVAQAQAEAAQARLDAAGRAASAHLNVLLSLAVADVAKASVAQIEAQLERARTQEAAGVLNKVDVLRLIAARDTAKQEAINAETDVQVARGQLALALNMPVQSLPEVADDLPDPPKPIVTTAEQAMQQAASTRPEVRRAAEQIKQAEASKAVAQSDYLPSINAVGTYQHVTGQGPFQPRNAWYVGATLSWEIWSWGATYEGVKAARARAEQAQFAAQSVQNQILLEARERLLATQAAFANLDPARTALEAASEAHRIQSLRFAEGVASTTDILAAETELSRARAGYAQARYRYYQTQAALARSTGQLPMQN